MFVVLFLPSSICEVEGNAEEGVEALFEVAVNGADNEAIEGKKDQLVQTQKDADHILLPSNSAGPGWRCISDAGWASPEAKMMRAWNITR